MTGPKPLLHRILLHMQVTVGSASSLAMVMINMLFRQWGIEARIPPSEAI